VENDLILLSIDSGLKNAMTMSCCCMGIRRLFGSWQPIFSCKQFVEFL